MPINYELIGQKIGKLLVLNDSGIRSKSGQVKWECKCDCGNTCIKTKSEIIRRPHCGCQNKKRNVYIGYRIGKLVVVEYLGLNENKRNIWKCRCDCGNEKIYMTSQLTNGKTKSCGCSHHEIGKYLRKYNDRDRKLYYRWTLIKQRCNNPNNKRYKDYGGRGITICNEWNNDFYSFRDWAISNGYEENLTIDRIDNNKGYSPDNCRWVTNKQQANNKRTNRYITIDGITKTMKQWADEYNIDYHTVQNRIFHGWDEIEAIITPLKWKRKK